MANGFLGKIQLPCLFFSRGKKKVTFKKYFPTRFNKTSLGISQQTGTEKAVIFTVGMG